MATIDPSAPFPDPRSFDSPADFAAALRKLRERTELSIRDIPNLLYEKTGISVATSTLGGWLSGRYLPTPKLASSLPALLSLFGVDDSREHDEWLAALARVRRVPGPRSADSGTPFRGLAAYEPEHARFFCGRDAVVDELVGLVTRPGRCGLMTVIGPSGSGKSSLLRAGLVARLSATHQCKLMTPGDTPVAGLARRIVGLAGPTTEECTVDLMRDAAAVGGRVRAAVAEADRDFVLVVDQFEEIFTLCHDDRQRQAFIDALAAMTVGDDPVVSVVLGMRADFYSHVLGYPAVRESLRRGSFAVGPMSEDEIREAITEPARRAKLALERGLVELLIRDTATTGIRPGTPDAVTLPLLSHALLATCQQARGRTLTVEHYRATGGIQGAVSRSAEDAFGRLDTPDRREVARRLFLRLVHVGDDTHNSRRRVPRDEIFEGRSPAEVEDIGRVLDEFLAARLISVDADTVEITHEALLSAWHRLRDWLAADESGHRMSRRLASAATGWHEAGRDPDLLYRGGQLQMAIDWADDPDNKARMTAGEAQFLDASSARHAEELRGIRRRVRRRYQLTSTLVALVLVVAGVAAYAIQLRMTSARERTAAHLENMQGLSRYVANEADRLRGEDVPLSMELAMAAYRISPTVEARSSLLNSSTVTSATRTITPGGPATVVASSPDGRLVAVGTGFGAVEVWRVDSSGRLTFAAVAPEGVSSDATAVAFSADGRMLVAAGSNAVVRVWRLTDPSHPALVATVDGLVSEPLGAAISPDGDVVVAGSGTGQLLAWDLATGAAPVTLQADGPPVRSVAFAPTGRTVVVGGDDGHVTVWGLTDPASPVPLAVLAGPQSRVFAVAVSPDGRYLAAGTSAQHDVYLWDISDPAHPRSLGPPLTGPRSWVNTVGFSPDSATLAVGASDNLVWLYDVRTHAVVGTLPHPHPIDSLAFRTGTSIVTAADDGVVRTWHLPGPFITGAKDSVFALSFDANGGKLGIGPGSGDNSLTVWNVGNASHPVRIGPPLVNDPRQPAFSGSGALTPDGRIFAVGTETGDVQLWDISDPDHPHTIGAPLTSPRQLVESVNISGDGSLLAVSSDDGNAYLYDIRDPARPVLLAKLGVPNDGMVYQAAFDPHDDLLAMAAGNADVYLWNIRDRARPVLVQTVSGFAAPAYSVAFDPGGDVLAAGSADDTVRLWHVGGGGALTPLGGPLVGPVGYIYALSFDPKRRELAVGSTDDTVWLWDMSSPASPVHLATLTGPAEGILVVAFSPDGRTLAAGGHDPTVRLWDTDPGSVASWICATAGTPITLAEWSRYVPGLPYDPPCSGPVTTVGHPTG